MCLTGCLGHVSKYSVHEGEGRDETPAGCGPGEVGGVQQLQRLGVAADKAGVSGGSKEVPAWSPVSLASKDPRQRDSLEPRHWFCSTGNICSSARQPGPLT